MDTRQRDSDTRGCIHTSRFTPWRLPLANLALFYLTYLQFWSYNFYLHYQRKKCSTLMIQLKFSYCAPPGQRQMVISGIEPALTMDTRQGDSDTRCIHTSRFTPWRLPLVSLWAALKQDLICLRSLLLETCYVNTRSMHLQSFTTRLRRSQKRRMHISVRPT